MAVVLRLDLAKNLSLSHATDFHHGLLGPADDTEHQLVDAAAPSLQGTHSVEERGYHRHGDCRQRPVREDFEMSNPYCEILGIQIPSLEAVKGHPKANTYALLIVALLEHGDAMTLRDVAGRFERAGIDSAEGALRSLRRCRPARPPIYRDGDDYSLDPHDEELDLWAFRLGLRPPKVPMLRPVPPPPEPLPGPEVPLASSELEEAFRDAYLTSWSAQRLALAVLDSHGGRLPAQRVIEELDRLTSHHVLREDAARYWRRGAAVKAAEDGSWEMDAGHRALRSAREAVRKRLEVARRWERQRPDPAAQAVHRRRFEAQRAARAAELAQLRRVLVHAFPHKRPQALVLVDVAARELRTYLREELDEASARLGEYELIGAVEVRPLLKALGFDPGEQRLAELGPPQKTRTLNRRGRTLKITTTLLIQGSCGIARPFGDPAKLREYLRDGQTTRLRRRLEADAKSLYALYQYGRLHGRLRLRWGFLDEGFPAPWVSRDEPTLYHLMKQAHGNGGELEVVIGSAPGWAEPWARARRCSVVRDVRGYGFVMVDADGFAVDDQEVQLARPAASPA